MLFVPVVARIDPLLSGMALTAGIAAVAIGLSLPVGIALALARRAGSRLVRWLAAAYLDLFRNTPFVVQLFFFYYGLPELGVLIDEITTGIVALALATAANVAEIVRAGIDGVAPGVRDAARAAGLSAPQQYRHVVLPIAFRFAIRPLGSVFVNLVLTTSVLSTITVDELMSRAETVASDTARPFEAYLVVLLLYCVLTFAVAAASGAVSAWLRRSSERVAAF